MRRVRVLGLLVVLLVFAGWMWRSVFDGSSARDDGALRLHGNLNGSANADSTSLPGAMQADAATAALERTAVSSAESAESDDAATEQDAASSFHLFVLDTDGATPRANFQLRMLACSPEAPGKLPSLLVQKSESLETDGAGRVQLQTTQFAVEGASLVRFFPTEDASMRCDPMELSIRELSRDPNAPTVVQLIARASGVIHGLAVDANTNEPLPRIALRVQRWLDIPDADSQVEDHYSKGFLVAARFFEPRNAEWVVTGDDGRFTTERAYSEGRIGFLTIDQARADLFHDPLAGALDTRLKVPVGPVVLLNFEPGANRSAEDYVAAIYRAPEELVATTGILEYPSPWSADKGKRTGYRGIAAPVQGGATPFVRMTAEQAREPLPSFLCLLSRDGASFGFAAVSTFEPYRHRPLQVNVQERLALSGVLIWPDGAFDSISVVVFLQNLALPDDEAREFSLHRIRGEAETSFQFQALAPGSYRLNLVATELEPLSLDVEMPGAVNLVLRPLLGTRDDPHAFSVRIVSDSGLAQGGENGRAHLRNFFLIGEDGNFRHGIVSWKNGEGHVAIQGLEPGEYSFSSGWVSGAHQIEPADQKVQVPGAELLLRVRDQEATIRAEVSVLNPPSAGVIMLTAQDEANLSFSQILRFKPEDERSHLPDGRTSLRLVTGPIAANLRLHCRFRSEEHRFVILEDEAFSAPNRDGVRSVQIESRPGWAANIHVWDVESESAETREDAPNLVLTLDGVAQSPTDAKGKLLVTLDEPAQVIGIATPGWRLVTRTSMNDWGSVFADTGKFTLEAGFLDVFVTRTD